jgi:hypothetical protein
MYLCMHVCMHAQVHYTLVCICTCEASSVLCAQQAALYRHLLLHNGYELVFARSKMHAQV